MLNRTAIIYSRSLLGLDIKVWSTLLVAIIISALLFGFKAINDPSCSPITITARGTIQHKQSNVYYVSENILFKASSGDAKKVEWDFGDGTPLVPGTEKKHYFETEGDYQVSAIINGKCRETIRLSIRQIENEGSLFSADSTLRSPIMGNTYATAGTMESYSCHLPASMYKWMIENNESFEEKTGQSVSFSFSDTGTYILVVQLDNDENKLYRQTITVMPVSDGGTADVLPKPDVTPFPIPKLNTATEKELTLPQDQNLPTVPIPIPVNPPVTTKKKYLQVPRPELENMLRDVVEKKRNVPDFDYILCNGGNTIVTANQKSMPFSELCKKLQDRKGIFKAKVKDIKISSSPYEPETKCLLTLVLEYKQ